MNLKPALRYQMREYVVACGVFVLVYTFLIAFFNVILSLSPSEDPTVISGYNMACIIFFFVFGIILPRQAVRLCVQMGVSRRTSFLSVFLAGFLGCLILAALGEILLAVSNKVLNGAAVSSGDYSLYSVFYLNGRDVTLAGHGISVLLTALLCLLLFILGLFLTFLFWRLNKVGCVIGGLAIPAVLIGVPSLLAAFQEPLAPVIRLLRQLTSAFFASPWNAMVLCLGGILILAILGWMLVRRVNIRGGTLSSK